MAGSGVQKRTTKGLRPENLLWEVFFWVWQVSQSSDMLSHQVFQTLLAMFPIPFSDQVLSGYRKQVGVSKNRLRRGTIQMGQEKNNQRNQAIYFIHWILSSSACCLSFSHIDRSQVRGRQRFKKVTSLLLGECGLTYFFLKINCLLPKLKRMSVILIPLSH